MQFANLYHIGYERDFMHGEGTRTRFRGGTERREELGHFQVSSVGDVNMSRSSQHSMLIRIQRVHFRRVVCLRACYVTTHLQTEHGLEACTARARRRESGKLRRTAPAHDTHLYVCACMCTYIYIYIYRERERERERKREKVRERERERYSIRNLRLRALAAIPR